MLVEALLFGALIFLLWQSFRKPPGLPPGRWGLPLVGYIPLTRKSLEDQIQDLQKQHGDIFLNIFLCSDCNAASFKNHNTAAAATFTSRSLKSCPFVVIKRTQPGVKLHLLRKDASRDPNTSDIIQENVAAEGESPRKRPRVKTFSHPLGELQECASHCSAPAPCTDFGCELDGVGGNSTRPSSSPQYNMKSENCCTQQSAVCARRQVSSKPRLLQLLGSFCPEPAIF